MTVFFGFQMALLKKSAESAGKDARIIRVAAVTV